MEASAIPASVGLTRTRIAIGAPLLRIRSDEQLVSLFRAGNDEAFRAIHDRYRHRLFVYTRQMLGGSAADAEDAVQEIFVRAYAGLRASDRELALRAWLYRVAHNRCIDELRRPFPAATDSVEATAAGSAHDPVARAEQREALRRLIADVRRLPDQQRSALLMRELGGVAYADIAGALAVTVPAVKSLLVRARVGLAQASEARDTTCAEIREDLIFAHDRGVRASGLARRHMRDCASCRQFRSEVRGVSRQFAALAPTLGPLGVVAKLLGLGSGGGAAAGSVGSGCHRRGCRRRRPRGDAARRRGCHRRRRDRATAGDASYAPFPRPPPDRPRVTRGAQPVRSGRSSRGLGRLARSRTRCHRRPGGPPRVGRERTGDPRRADCPPVRALTVGILGSPPHLADSRSRSAVLQPGQSAERVDGDHRRHRLRGHRYEHGHNRNRFGHRCRARHLRDVRSDATRRAGHDQHGHHRWHQRRRYRLGPVGADERWRRDDELHRSDRLGRRLVRELGDDVTRRRQIRSRVHHEPVIEPYLEKLDHEELLVRRGQRSGLYVMAAVHSTARGPSLGGCRLWAYADTRAAVRDALRLSRAMTLKAAVANLDLGGGKGVIIAPANAPLPSRRRQAALLDFADLVESLEGRYITAEDVGTSSRDMSAIARRTGHVAGLARSRGGSGDPSPLTALGVEAAIRAACEQAFTDASLRGRSICVLGLGHVGARVARRCARAGARLIISDVDETKRRLADELGASWSTPSRALEADVDVLAPCALGGLLDDISVPRLRCRIIAGAANNQLAEDRVAERLEERGILWAPDFVANAGGVINIAEEIGGYHPPAARRRVLAIGDTLREIFARAQEGAITPLAAALELAHRRLPSPDGHGPLLRA